MKTAKLFWGLGFLFAAALIILDVVGVIPTLLSAVGEVSIFSLILGLFLLSYALRRLFRGRISAIFFAVSGPPALQAVTGALPSAMACASCAQPA